MIEQFFHGYFIGEFQKNSWQLALEKVLGACLARPRRAPKNPQAMQQKNQRQEAHLNTEQIAVAK